MPNKSGIKGKNFERQVVNLFKQHGLKAKRAYASNGESLGMAKEVDVVLEYDKKLFNNNNVLYTLPSTCTFQCKRLASFPKYLGFTDTVDSVIFREDKGDAYVMFRLNDFINRFLS